MAEPEKDMPKPGEGTQADAGVVPSKPTSEVNASESACKGGSSVNKLSVEQVTTSSCVSTPATAAGLSPDEGKQSSDQADEPSQRSAPKITAGPCPTDDKSIDKSGDKSVEKPADKSIDKPSPHNKNKGSGKADDVAGTDAAKDGAEEGKHKKVEAGTAAHLTTLLNKNRTREEVDHENKDLRKELAVLRKKLKDTADECESCRTAANDLLNHAKAKWTPEHVQTVTKILRPALTPPKERRTKKEGDQDALLNAAADRGPRRRQGRKRRSGKNGNGRRARSETQVRSGSGEGDTDGSSDETDEHDVEQRKQRRGRPKAAAQEGNSSAQQPFMKMGFPPRPSAGRRREDPQQQQQRAAPEGRRPPRGGRRQEADRPMWGPPKTATQRSGRVENQNSEGDPENESIRSLMREATSVAQLEEAITKAQAKNMEYEVQLGNRKLERMKGV